MTLSQPRDITRQDNSFASIRQSTAVNLRIQITRRRKNMASRAFICFVYLFSLIVVLTEGNLLNLYLTSSLMIVIVTVIYKI